MAAVDAARSSLVGARSPEAGVQRIRPVALAAAIAVALLAAELIYIPLASPRFAVREVEIRGDERVARACLRHHPSSRQHEHGSRAPQAGEEAGRKLRRCESSPGLAARSPIASL